MRPGRSRSTATAEATGPATGSTLLGSEPVANLAEIAAQEFTPEVIGAATGPLGKMGSRRPLPRVRGTVRVSAGREPGTKEIGFSVVAPDVGQFIDFLRDEISKQV